MVKTGEFSAWPNMALANQAVQLFFMAAEARKLAAARVAALAGGNVSLGDELRTMVTERLAALRESREIFWQALQGGRADLGFAPLLQLYRKKLREGERRLTGQLRHSL